VLAVKLLRAAFAVNLLRADIKRCQNTISGTSKQRWTWVGIIHELGWVAFSSTRDGLGSAGLNFALSFHGSIELFFILKSGFLAPEHRVVNWYSEMDMGRVSPCDWIALGWDDFSGIFRGLGPGNL